MLDMKLIRKDPGFVRDATRKKQVDVDVGLIIKLDEEKRNLLSRVETLRGTQNRTSSQIAKATGESKAKLIAEMKKVADEIKAAEPRLAETEEELRTLLLKLPNPPEDSVPVGEDDTANVSIREWGKPDHFGFEPVDHLDLGTSLDLIDIERAAKV
ncbi:MAG: serine--tRNA ligase, partial [Terriglobia bacterium]